jgi:hypothetical protein
MEFFKYKGHHLVRKNNKVHYGNMSGDFVTVIDIQSTKKVGGTNGKPLNIADKVRIQLWPTDTENLDMSKIKTTSRDSLYEALEVAHNWLVKAN